MLPADAHSPGGVFIPHMARQEPETEHGRHRLMNPRGEPFQGFVRAIGPWTVVKRGRHKGFQIMPEFKVGDRVVIGTHAGQALKYDVAGHFRLVEQQEVLAVLEAELSLLDLNQRPSEDL